MQIFRIVLVILVMGGTAILLGHTVYDGLKTGKIKYSESRNRCERKANPWGYWGLIALFAASFLLVCRVAVALLLGV